MALWPCKIQSYTNRSNGVKGYTVVALWPCKIQSYKNSSNGVKGYTVVALWPCKIQSRAKQTVAIELKDTQLWPCGPAKYRAIQTGAMKLN